MLDNPILTSVEFAKYRVFDQRQRMELKPLTLLFGHNSVGKSAALRLLSILAAAARGRNRNPNSSVLDYSSPALRDARFIDLIHNGQVASGMQFVLHWEQDSYDVTIRDLGDDGEIISAVELKLNGETYRGEPGEGEDARRLDFDVGGEKSSWGFSGLLPSDATDGAGKDIAHRLCERLGAFGDSVHWLGAVRAAVPRHFEMRPDSDGTIAPDGSGVAEAIRISAASEDGATEAVSEWLKTTCDCSLSYAASDGTLLYGRRYFPFDVIAAGRRVAVRDVGEGIAQALPVVMLCHQARLGQLGDQPILAFEQPELHLHPAASVKLADEIMACIADGSPARHVIETHAESMLLSVQIAIVDGRIKPDDVMVYWVSPSDEGTSLRPITFDESGFVRGGWPQGVFRETIDQARRLSKLRTETQGD